MSEERTYITCFGELLLRLSPVLAGAWIRSQQMSVFIGGAELNVATALAGWRLPVHYATVLPNHYLAHEIVEELSAKSIDTSRITFAGDRIGTYYLPQGTDIKQGGVIYDRAHSSFWNLRPGDISWSHCLEGSKRFHFSAISPALNASVAELCLQAVQYADQAQLPVSVDLNDRSKLWQYTSDKPAIMRRYLPYCRVVMGNLWSVESLLNIPHGITDSLQASNDVLIAAAKGVVDSIQAQWPQVETIAFTFRMQDRYFTTLSHQDVFVVSPVFDMQDIVNQVGSGDCYMAGLIYGLEQSWSAQKIVNFATAAARGKMNESGDATRQTVSDIDHFLQTNNQKSDG